MGERDLVRRVRYPQPHSLYIEASNPALEDHLRLKLHGTLKYNAKYGRSKKSKRGYGNSNKRDLF